MAWVKMSPALEKRFGELEEEITKLKLKLKGEVDGFRTFFKETIEHYDRLLPERLAIQQKRAKARGLA